jgi:hypothetical protein
MLHNKKLKDEYYEEVLGRILIDRNDLSETETEIIEIGYELIAYKLEEASLLMDEIKRLKIENANLRSYQDDTDYPEHETSS